MNFKEHMSKDDIKKRLRLLNFQLDYVSVYKDYNPKRDNRGDKGIFADDRLILKTISPIKMPDGYEYMIKPSNRGPKAVVFFHRAENGEISPPEIPIGKAEVLKVTYNLARRKIGSNEGFYVMNASLVELSLTQRAFILMTSVDQIKEKLSSIMKEPYFFPTLNHAAIFRGGASIEPNELSTILGIKN